MEVKSESKLDTSCSNEILRLWLGEDIPGPTETSCGSQHVGSVSTSILGGGAGVSLDLQSRTIR